MNYYTIILIIHIKDKFKNKNFLSKKSYFIFLKSEFIIFIFLVPNILFGIKTNIHRYFLSAIFKLILGNNMVSFTITNIYLLLFIKNKIYISFGKDIICCLYLFSIKFIFS